MQPTNRSLQGFGNFGSLGTQIGVLSQIAPSRAGDVSTVALSALFSGVISTLTSASVAGMLITSERIEEVASTT
jgi:concentrative nucleoside transporter, CNT family